MILNVRYKQGGFKDEPALQRTNQPLTCHFVTSSPKGRGCRMVFVENVECITFSLWEKVRFAKAG